MWPGTREQQTYSIGPYDPAPRRRKGVLGTPASPELGPLGPLVCRKGIFRVSTGISLTMPMEMLAPSSATRSPPPIRKALLQLTLKRTAPRLARHSVRSMLHWVPSEATDRIELLVSELLTNSVIHSGLDGNQTADLRLTCGEDRVRLEVADRGRRFRAVSVEPRPGPLGRWGFHLVNKLSDRWGVSELDQGKSVWFEIDL